MGDAGEDGDLRWDGTAWIHESLEGAQTLTTAEFDRTDLGDGTGICRSSGCLEIDDAEGHLGEGSPEIIERELDGIGGGGTHITSLIERVFVCKGGPSASLVSVRVHHQIPLYRLRKSHPFRRHLHKAHTRLPPLQRRWRIGD